MPIQPASRPAASRAKVLEAVKAMDLDRAKEPLILIGVRGYYRDTMGRVGVNDRGFYDDAIFIDAPEAFVAFNANTDPSRYKPGAGKGTGKGMANLKTGVWRAHRIGKHKTQYPALVQLNGAVTVRRDGQPDYDDTGFFGINIHRGGVNGTSSLGCQTLPPKQWDAFISTVVDQAKRNFGAKWEKTTIPYVLIDGPIN